MTPNLTANPLALLTTATPTIAGGPAPASLALDTGPQTDVSPDQLDNDFSYILQSLSPLITEHPSSLAQTRLPPVPVPGGAPTGSAVQTTAASPTVLPSQGNTMVATQGGALPPPGGSPLPLFPTPNPIPLKTVPLPAKTPVATNVLPVTPMPTHVGAPGSAITSSGESSPLNPAATIKTLPLPTQDQPPLKPAIIESSPPHVKPMPEPAQALRMTAATTTPASAPLVDTPAVARATTTAVTSDTSTAAATSTPAADVLAKTAASSHHQAVPERPATAPSPAQVPVPVTVPEPLAKQAAVPPPELNIKPAIAPAPEPGLVTTVLPTPVRSQKLELRSAGNGTTYELKTAMTKNAFDLTAANSDNDHTVIDSARALSFSPDKLNSLQSAAAPLPLTRSVGMAGWNQALGQRILWMVDNGLGQAELRLDPPHLGSINVRISMQDDQAQLIMQAANPAARDALESALPRLKEMFAEQGLQLANTEIDHHDGQTGSQPEQDQDRALHGDVMDAGSAAGESETADAASDQPRGEASRPGMISEFV